MIIFLKKGSVLHEIELDSLSPMAITTRATKFDCEAMYHGFLWNGKLLYKSPSIGEEEGRWLTRPIPLDAKKEVRRRK